jgi:hypothetical protein
MKGKTPYVLVCVCMLGIALGSAFIFSFLIVVKNDWYDKN